jgi:NMD protein affecting ribosome stability and mRNA decay
VRAQPEIRSQSKQSRGLIRSLNRSAVRDDKSPHAARKTRPLHEPTVCARCGAVFLRKTWRHNHVLSDAQIERRQWGFCPACHQVSPQEGQERLLIKGVATAARRDTIAQRIQNVAEHASKTQPERRLVSLDNRDGELEVLTTSQKLAHRLAHELKKAFGGRVGYTWSDDGTLFATWDHDVAKGAPRRRRG